MTETNPYKDFEHDLMLYFDNTRATHDEIKGRAKELIDRLNSVPQLKNWDRREEYINTIKTYALIESNLAPVPSEEALKQVRIPTIEELLRREQDS